MLILAPFDALRSGLMLEIVLWFSLRALLIPVTLQDAILKTPFDFLLMKFEFVLAAFA